MTTQQLEIMSCLSCGMINEIFAKLPQYETLLCHRCGFCDLCHNINGCLKIENDDPKQKINCLGVSNNIENFPRILFLFIKMIFLLIFLIFLIYFYYNYYYNFFVLLFYSYYLFYYIKYLILVFLLFFILINNNILQF